MKFIHIITTALAMISITACAIDNLDLPTSGINKSDEITIVGRATRFDDYDVETRAAKQPEEVEISSYAVAIFEVNETSVGACKYFKHDPNASQIMLTLSRYDEDGEVLLFEKDKPYAIYVFANMPGMGDFDTTNSLDDMLEVAYSVDGIGVPEKGFPMIGSMGDRVSTKIDRDGKTLIMYSSLPENPPTVDGENIPVLNIPMRALFAKINFEIEVRPEQMIQGGDFTPQFTLNSYIVKNIPRSVDFDNTTNAIVDNFDVFNSNVVSDFSGNRTASGTRKINFSFYVPENLLPEGTYTSWDQYEYPFGKGTSIRDEDMKYRQRYKGKLVEGKPATNIVLSGEYRDHQNHSVEVNYTIHLGEDNYNDFNIKRNGEYNNYVTIKGILNSDDKSGGDSDNYISLDHRVNIKYKEPVIISLRRELLLDSHFEIRPLRIKKNSVFDGNIQPTHVKVEVVNPTSTNWMRLERSFGDGVKDGVYPKNGKNEFIYIDNDAQNNGASVGKRRYFTYDLVTAELAASGQSVIIPLTPKEKEDQTAWIYVDECTEIGDGIRTGTIRVTYGQGEGEEFEEIINPAFPPIDYIINQRLLYPVTYGEHSYNIEFYEEYLYNFDSEDAYIQTDQAGMTWGLEGLQLSNKNDAIYLTGKGNNIFDAWAGASVDDIINMANAALPVDPKYDFYLSRDTQNEKLVVRDYAGWEFNQEIIAYLKSEYKDNDKAKLEGITLNEKPKSAIAYCYNRNKRDSNGNVVLNNDKGWFLPSIDQIEEIVKAEYASYFKEFQDNMYWSCQPSYIANSMKITRYNWIIFLGWADHDPNDGTFEGLYYIDDTRNARATKALSINGEYAENPDSGSDIFMSYPNGIFYLSNSSMSGNKNRTMDIGSSSVLNEDYNNIEDHPGNMPRDTKARVRCVRKMN